MAKEDWLKKDTFQKNPVAIHDYVLVVDVETGKLNLGKGAVLPSNPELMKIKVFKNTADDVRYNAEFDYSTYEAVFQTVPVTHKYVKVGFSNVKRYVSDPGKLYLKGAALEQYLEYYVEFESRQLMAAGLNVNSFPIGKC